MLHREPVVRVGSVLLIDAGRHARRLRRGEE
jgi:hypothetical protein